MPSSALLRYSPFHACLCPRGIVNLSLVRVVVIKNNKTSILAFAREYDSADATQVMKSTAGQTLLLCLIVLLCNKFLLLCNISQVINKYSILILKIIKMPEKGTNQRTRPFLWCIGVATPLLLLFPGDFVMDSLHVRQED